MSDNFEDRLRATVRALAATDETHADIARHVGMSLGDLRRKFRKELKYGKAVVRSHLKVRLIEKAIKGDARSMFGWFRQYDGWVPTNRTELTGVNGGPISFERFDPNSLAQFINALREAISSEASRRGSQNPTLDLPRESVRDLEAISGPTDEGVGE